MRTLRALLCFMIVTGWFSSAFSRTWVIKPDGTGEAPTIQAGIDSATTSDVVLLSPGSYTGTGNRNVDFRGKAITVTSLSGPAFTVIDCEGNTRGFFFTTGEGPSSVLERVTIARGFTNFFGGAVLCRSASPTLRDNVFIGNQSGFQGGAVYCDSSAAIVTGNLFQQNGAPSGGGLWCSGGSTVTVSENRFTQCGALNVGGALACNASAPTITANTFSDNSAQLGGAIDLVAGSTPTIQENTFERNQAGRGGAIRCNQSAPAVRRNVFFANASGLGGAILCDNVSLAIIENNTFDANNAAAGAGIYCDNFSDAGIYNNIVVGSTGGNAVETANFALPEIGCCDFFNNAGGDALPVGCLDAGGNISVGPRFCGVSGSGNYSLQRNSPCASRNAGVCGLMGAFPVACGPSARERYVDPPVETANKEYRTWGAIKAMYEKP